jgi:endonuclease/exonuclease/phosphatase family metal-dependent hydrolase
VPCQRGELPLDGECGVLLPDRSQMLGAPAPLVHLGLQGLTDGLRGQGASCHLAGAETGLGGWSRPRDFSIVRRRSIDRDLRLVTVGPAAPPFKGAVVWSPARTGGRAARREVSLMRILTLNTWGGAMFDALAAWLPTCGADVVCLQEVTRTAGVRGWTMFADGERTLPQRADLFADVVELLPGYQGHFLASDAGPVTDDEGGRWQQDFGIATFVHERLPVLGTSSAFIHGSFTEYRDWTAAGRPRVAHGVRVIERASGATFTVVNLHGLRDGAGKGDTPSRRAQADRIAELVRTLRCEGDEVAVVGDFNLLPDSETFEVLAELGLTDLVQDADTRTSRYLKPVRHADYLLVSAPAKVRHFEIVTAPELSDHRALVVDL